MSTTQTRSLTDLIAYLDSLTGPAELDDIRARLQAADITSDDLGDRINFASECYQRNLVAEGEHYILLALCWGSGQRSKIHDHACSECGFKVISGVATETIFERTESGLVRPIRSTDHQQGAVGGSHPTDIHQITNFQGEDCCLITLHVYSPKLENWECYEFQDA